MSYVSSWYAETIRRSIYGWNARSMAEGSLFLAEHVFSEGGELRYPERTSSFMVALDVQQSSVTQLGSASEGIQPSDTPTLMTP